MTDVGIISESLNVSQRLATVGLTPQALARRPDPEYARRADDRVIDW